MLELLQSKKFLSAIIGTFFLIVVNFIFVDNPEKIDELQYIILGLFGLQIGAQGLADLGKEKTKAEAEKTKIEKEKTELEVMLEKERVAYNTRIAPIAKPVTTPNPTDHPWSEQ